MYTRTWTVGSGVCGEGRQTGVVRTGDRHAQSAVAGRYRVSVVPVVSLRVVYHLLLYMHTRTLTEPSGSSTTSTRAASGNSAPGRGDGWRGQPCSGSGWGRQLHSSLHAQCRAGHGQGTAR